jgi:hypothetical protein
LACSFCSSSFYVLLFHVHIFSFIVNFLYPILTLLPFSFFAFVSSRIHPYMPRSFLVKSFVIKIFLFSFSRKHDFFFIISIFFSYLLTCPTYIFLLILYTLSISKSISRLFLIHSSRFFSNISFFSCLVPCLVFHDICGFLFGFPSLFP